MTKLRYWFYMHLVFAFIGLLSTTLIFVAETFGFVWSIVLLLIIIEGLVIYIIHDTGN